MKRCCGLRGIGDLHHARAARANMASTTMTTGKRVHALVARHSGLPSARVSTAGHPAGADRARAERLCVDYPGPHAVRQRDLCARSLRASPLTEIQRNLPAF